MLDTLGHVVELLRPVVGLSYDCRVRRRMRQCRRVYRDQPLAVVAAPGLQPAALDLFTKSGDAAPGPLRQLAQGDQLSLGRLRHVVSLVHSVHRDVACDKTLDNVVGTSQLADGRRKRLRRRVWPARLNPASPRAAEPDHRRRDGARGRFFNVVDLVNKLEAEGRAGRQGDGGSPIYYVWRSRGGGGCATGWSAGMIIRD